MSLTIQETLQSFSQNWWQIQKGYLKDEIQAALSWCGYQAPLADPGDLEGIDMGKLQKLTRQTQEDSQIRDLEISRIGEDLKEDLKRLEEDHSRAHFFTEAEQKGMDSRYEAVMHFFTGLFQKLRRIHLEQAGAYDPEIHLPLLERMDWNHFTNQEAMLCPPFVLFVGCQGDRRELNQRLYSLLSQGRPYKIIALLDEIPVRLKEEGRGIALSLHPDAAFFALGMRYVYVLQGMAANFEKLTPAFIQALQSPRPALCSLYQGGQPELALYSRSIPNLRYDPDQGQVWPSGMDISLNPEWEEPWVQGKLHEKAEEEALTFCHYAWGLPELQGEFTLIESLENTTPIADYLSLNAKERAKKNPILWAGEGEVPQAYRPSARLLHYAMDRAQLWESLHRVSEGNATKSPETQNQPAPETATNEEKIKEEAVAQAMAELSKKLLGLEELNLELGGQTLSLDLQAGTVEAKAATVPPLSSPTADSAVSAELPWIESALCTACEECVQINKKLFAYNDQKQAYFTDPKAGPFKDIVKAAEKCSAAIIHPGQPLNPKEKDLAKWVKRAAKFQ